MDEHTRARLVSIVRCDSYAPESVERALDAVLAPVGGLSWVRPGMTVAIKANLVSFMKPEACATTHPALLCALTRRLRERGAAVIIGDSPGGLYTAAYVGRVYAATGMKEAEAAGAALNRDFSERTASFPEGKAARQFLYTGWLDSADAIINFCKLKAHGMMGMSAAVKNLFGTIPGTTKPEYHYRFPQPEDFADMLVDLNEYFRPCLNLVDAIDGMEGNGPTAGTPRHIGALLASVSPYNLDLVCARLIGLAPADIPTLQAAARRGLAPETAEQVPCTADPAGFAVADFQPAAGHSLSFGGNRWYGQMFGRIARAALRNKPRVQPEMCVGCGECARICPAKAITMENRLPVIDRGRCICCFCCQEFCPKGAMRVHRPAVARILNRGK